MQPKLPSDFLAARAQCWLMFKLMSFKTPRCFSAELLSSWVAHSTYGAWSHPSPPAAHCNLLVDLHEIPISSPIYTVEVHLHVVMALWWASTAPRYLSYGDLLQVYSAPPARPLMKMLNRAVPSTRWTEGRTVSVDVSWDACSTTNTDIDFIHSVISENLTPLWDPIISECEWPFLMQFTLSRFSRASEFSMQWKTVQTCQRYLKARKIYKLISLPLCLKSLVLM